MTPPPNRPLQVLQAPKLEALLRAIGTGENFNSRCAPAIAFGELPFTTREDLLADRLAHPPFGSALTEPLANYTRFCQTSGTSTGQPMAWIDTPKSWEAMLNCWRWVYRGAQLRKGEDRVFFAFSFGPFLGFWTAFAGFQITFLSMFVAGLQGMPRRVFQFNDAFNLSNQISTGGAYIIGIGMLILLFAIVSSWRSGVPATSNPWGAKTLEWQTETPVPLENFPVLPVVTGDFYDYGVEDPYEAEERAMTAADDVTVGAS